MKHRKESTKHNIYNEVKISQLHVFPFFNTAEYNKHYTLPPGNTDHIEEQITKKLK